MKLGFVALLFTYGALAEEVKMPFDMNQMATWMKMSALERYNDYLKVNGEAWKKDANYDSMDDAAKAAYDASYKKHLDEAAAYAKKVRDAAGYDSLDQAKKDKIDTELWQNQLKMDVQKKMSQKIQESITEELVKENPKIKEQLEKMTPEEKSSFTNTVKDMAGDMIKVQKKKSEAQLIAKAEAKVFEKSADEQNAFDEAQKKLREAAEKQAAEEQAKAAAAAAKASAAAALEGGKQLTFAEKLAAMKKENEKKIKEEEAKAAQAVDDMKKLVNSGFLGKTEEQQKADLEAARQEVVKRTIEAEKKKAEEQALLIPLAGERAFPCGRNEKLPAEPKRAKCKEGLCCGSGLPLGTPVGDELKEGNGRVEVCFDFIATTYTHKALGKEDVQMAFQCIDGAKKFAASAITALGAAYLMA